MVEGIKIFFKNYGNFFNIKTNIKFKKNGKVNIEFKKCIQYRNLQIFGKFNKLICNLVKIDIRH